jgi:hypothetical protein
MTLMQINELRKAAADFRYVNGAEVDWVSGRRDGLTDDETEQRANDAIFKIDNDIDELLDLAQAQLELQADIESQQIASDELTCHDCDTRSWCEFVDDPYNTDGDCLAMK